MRVAVVSLAVFSCLQAVGLAEPGPRPPCGVESTPRYPDLEHSPAFKVWDRASMGRDWMPPGCLGWSTPGFATLLTTVARFRYSGGVEELLGRVGRISGLTGIRYWSTTRQHWAPLIVSASALAGPEGAHHRQDFSLPELAQGSTVYYQQSDNTSGKATYQLRIVSVSRGSPDFRDRKYHGDAVPAGAHFSAARISSNLFSGAGIARRLAILQHRAHWQGRQRTSEWTRCFHHQPRDGVFPILNWNPDGSGTASGALILLVRIRGLEPPLPCENMDLNHARKIAYGRLR